MSIRENLDITAYLIVGPENTNGRPIGEVVSQALRAGFTCFQIRSKGTDAQSLIEYLREAADAISAAGKQDEVALLVNDRLDVALASRDLGIKVDGVHVGQSDIPPEICRKYLGEDAIVGFTAAKYDMVEYIRAYDASCIDYYGVGPLRATATKQDLSTDEAGNLITQNLGSLREIARVATVPVVVGGGVTVDDVPMIRDAGLQGFFVVSAVCGSDDPYEAAKELVEAWNQAE